MNREQLTEKDFFKTIKRQFENMDLIWNQIGYSPDLNDFLLLCSAVLSNTIIDIFKQQTELEGKASTFADASFAQVVSSVDTIMGEMVIDMMPVLLNLSYLPSLGKDTTSITGLLLEKILEHEDLIANTFDSLLDNGYDHNQFIRWFNVTVALVMLGGESGSGLDPAQLTELLNQVTLANDVSKTLAKLQVTVQHLIDTFIADATNADPLDHPRLIDSILVTLKQSITVSVTELNDLVNLQQENTLIGLQLEEFKQKYFEYVLAYIMNSLALAAENASYEPNTQLENLLDEIIDQMPSLDFTE